MSIGSFHIDHLSTPVSQELHHGSHALVWHVNNQEFQRLLQFVAFVPIDDFRFADSQFVTLATHVFQQDTQVENPSAGDDELVASLFKPEGDVGPQFFS